MREGEPQVAYLSVRMVVADEQGVVSGIESAYHYKRKCKSDVTKLISQYEPRWISSFWIECALPYKVKI